MADSLPPFSLWLPDHRRGELDSEITAGLAEVVDACRATGKPGSVTIELNIKPSGPSCITVMLVDNVKVKVPQPDREASVYYVTREAGLSRVDPMQQTLSGPRHRLDPKTGVLEPIDPEEGA